MKNKNKISTITRLNFTDFLFLSKQAQRTRGNTFVSYFMKWVCKCSYGYYGYTILHRLCIYLKVNKQQSISSTAFSAIALKGHKFFVSACALRNFLENARANNKSLWAESGVKWIKPFVRSTWLFSWGISKNKYQSQHSNIITVVVRRSTKSIEVKHLSKIY